MAINNPQTWTRLRRIALRSLANHVGNEVMGLIKLWPQTGEGRAVKATTEKITRRLDGQQQLRDIDRAFSELLISADDFETLLTNPFFTDHMSERLIGVRSQHFPLGNYVLEQIAETRRYIEQYRASLPRLLRKRKRQQRLLRRLCPSKKRDL